MLLDMYPKGAMHEQPYREGQNPFEIAQYFDSGNYTIRRNWPYQNLWIQGGPRARLFFRDQPKKAPAMNKIPLVKWDASYAYVSSTHMLLPRGLNLAYDDRAVRRPSGCLLHAKFLDTFAAKAEEELRRGQHYAESHEYRAYREGIAERARSVVQLEREVHQLAPAGDSGADVERELGVTAGRGHAVSHGPGPGGPGRAALGVAGCPVVIHLDRRVSELIRPGLRRRWLTCPTSAFRPASPANGAPSASSRRRSRRPAQMLAEFPGRQPHVYLASGSCLPIRPVRDLQAHLDAHPRHRFHRKRDHRGCRLDRRRAEQGTLYPAVSLFLEAAARPVRRLRPLAAR